MNATSSHVATILVLYTVLSLCHTLFKKANFTPKFILFVYGPRSNFKTSLSLALTQLEYRDTPFFTLKATKATIESSFRNYKDSVILVDDLAPALNKADRRTMESTLETITRAFGDATAHRRCTLQYNEEKGNKIGQYEAEGGCVLTGEYYTGCESSLARTLFVELKKESVNLDLLSYIQSDRHLVEHFAVCFLSYLTRIINDNNMDIIGFIEKRGKELRKEYGFRYSNERYSEYIAQLSTVADLLVLVASYFNLLTPQEIEQYKTRFSRAIIDVVEQNNTRLIAQNPTTVLCNALKSAIEDENVLYCPLGSVVQDYDNVIFYKDDFLFVTQKGCAKLANAYLKESDISLAEFSSARVATTFENSHIISIVMEGASKRHASKLPGYGSKRFMKISKTELDRHATL